MCIRDRLETLPSSAAGTRRCRSVPQITVADENPKPVMKTTAAITQSLSLIHI